MEKQAATASAVLMQERWCCTGEPMSEQQLSDFIDSFGVTPESLASMTSFYFESMRDTAPKSPKS